MRQFIGNGSKLDKLNEIQNSLDCKLEGLKTASQAY